MTGNPIPNTRQIAYLQPTRSDLDSNGVIVNPFGSSATSPYFFMAIDTDYSGVVGDSGTAQGQLPDFTQYPTNYTGATTRKRHPGRRGGLVPVRSTAGRRHRVQAVPASFWAHTY